MVVTVVPSGCGKSSNRYRYGNGNDGYESDDACYGLYNLHIRVCLFAYFIFFCSKPTLCRGLRSAKSISLSRVLPVMMVVQCPVSRVRPVLMVVLKGKAPQMGFGVEGKPGTPETKINKV